MVLNSWQSSTLSFPGTGIMTVSHHTQLDFAWFQLMRDYSQAQACCEWMRNFLYTKKIPPDLCPLHPHPCWKSQRPTAQSVLQDIVSTIVNLTFPNLYLRVMACLLDSKSTNREDKWMWPSCFRSTVHTFGTKVNKSRQTHLGRYIPGMHVWKWHREPSHSVCQLKEKAY